MEVLSFGPIKRWPLKAFLTKKTAFPTFRTSLKCYEKFVVDTFIVIKKANLDDFFNHISSIHLKIKLIIENENDGCLPFFDNMFKKNNDCSICVHVYRKPTHI